MDILECKSSIERRMLSMPGVHGVSVGLKRVDGKLTKEICVTIHVSRKVPMEALPEEQRVPPMLDGFVTDVIEHPQMAPHQDQNRYRPLQGGCQIAFNNWVGTLGAFVKPNNVIIPGIWGLTNQHVLPTAGDVFQPNNTKSDKIGVQAKAVLSSTVDGAVCAIEETSWTNVILDIGVVAGTYNVTLSDLPYPVRKRGRTTFLTNGNITNIAYSGRRTDGWSFADQMFVQPPTNPFSAPGDSGSAIVDNNRRVVALLWGGNGFSGVGSPISAVQAQLDVTVVAGGVALAQHIPIRDRAHLREHMQQQLMPSADGAALMRFWDDNQEQLTNLIHHHKIVLATWARHHGDDIMRVMIDAIQQESAMPAEVQGAPIRPALEQIEQALVRYGDDKLRRDLEAIRPILDRALGEQWSWPAFVEGVRKPPEY